jgi:isopentenyl-diphosphate delta-isomerase
MPIEKLILVDPDDKPIGEIEKLLAHQYGMLHRAFSVFIFRKQKGLIQCLLQQRAKDKYHAALLWTNACCSHPHPNEDTLTSALARLQFEMGIEASLKEVGQFHYIAQFDNGLTENELDHVFVGFYDGEVIYNPEEVQDFAWIDIDALQISLKNTPNRYTPWFHEALKIALTGVGLE